MEKAMPAQRRKTGRRSNRVSPVSALALEAVALLGIFAIAQPELAISLLQRGNHSINSAQPDVPTVDQNTPEALIRQASLLPPVSPHPTLDANRIFEPSRTSVSDGPQPRFVRSYGNLSWSSSRY